MPVKSRHFAYNKTGNTALTAIVKIDRKDGSDGKTWRKDGYSANIRGTVRDIRICIRTGDKEQTARHYKTKKR